MIDLSWKVKKNTGPAARKGEKKADNAEPIGDSTGPGTRSSNEKAPFRTFRG
jgi:hypothetical protein